jgi:azurin
MRKSLVIGVIGILALLLACGGSGSEEAESATSSNTGASTAADQSAPPQSEAELISISAEGNRILFDTETITVSTGIEVTLTMSSSANTNAHNWVLIKADADKIDVAAAGLKAGQANDFVEPGDPRVIAYTASIFGGDSAQVTFTTPAVGTYTFVRTVPGHDRQMFGKFIVTG